MAAVGLIEPVNPLGNGLKKLMSAKERRVIFLRSGCGYYSKAEISQSSSRFDVGRFMNINFSGRAP